MTYSQSSPYFSTSISNGFLGPMAHRAIPKSSDDIQYTIRGVHALRPDLLAFDLYRDAGLWWVFAARNPNTLEDPVFDFQAGVTIYLPKLEAIKLALGI